MKEILIAAVTLSLLVAGCSQAHELSNNENKVTELRKDNMDNSAKKTWQQVTVKYLDFEGGFYGLVSKTGDKLLPMNLAKEYQLPGTVLKVQGHVIKDMMTIQQWGQVFKITEVELIKLGKANTGEAF
ncbi:MULTISPECIES: hypothetical protein [Colwellia]|uniref:Lipoprotein n=1 Tax=Colwellia marinimaniae TaxID=1513592 RepID=A0ABQ0MWS4_9GAMM|nr:MULTISPECIES: hypothetical protein [Colwellia]GAW96822.1 hypothetical protein MTCD1_02445 [Colwellia marinimaniae]